jgi:hypothetical protein
MQEIQLGIFAIVAAVVACCGAEAENAKALLGVTAVENMSSD